MREDLQHKWSKEMKNESLTNMTDLEEFDLREHMDHFPILAIFISVGVVVSFFNIFSACIIMCHKKLNRAHNYPIVR